MTSSVVGVGAGTNEYRLHAALQEDTKIKTYSYATMSVSGGLIGGSTDGGKGFFANQNLLVGCQPYEVLERFVISCLSKESEGSNK